MTMEKRYQYYQIREVSKKGMGVIAKRTFLPGDTVVVGRIVRRVAQRTRYSFQIDWDTHVDLDELARSFNHSCHPNLGVQKNQFGGYSFVAMRQIFPEEEFCWDYAMTEYESIAVQSCQCGSVLCRGRILGYRGLPEFLRVKYRGFTAPYLDDHYSTVSIT